jgi:hypothetical protein
MSPKVNREQVVTALQRHFENLNALAEKLRVSRQLLHYYLRTSFPLEQALTVDVMTDGDVSWRDLCPEVYERLAKYQETIRDTRQLELPFDDTRTDAVI